MICSASLQPISLWNLYCGPRPRDETKHHSQTELEYPVSTNVLRINIQKSQHFGLSPHFISSCSSGNLDSGFTIDIYTETCCVAKRMSKRCELARSIHLCNVVLTFLVCEHDTILMILMMAIVYTT